ncbi:hypothetical protein [Natrinema caseinilyticum]|uniref:hypothetical protein n=1 Tax=Natrinema caseinilyticum TaxID=2961570 RepID=UPI0020C44382|nr:hypothetical protein [Natrinema caseinilyticum]
MADATSGDGPTDSSPTASDVVSRCNVGIRETPRVWGRSRPTASAGRPRIGVTYRLLVERTQWISQRRFLHAMTDT